MATAKNKLPTFGADAETDNDIIANNSNLKSTGFQPNTTIKSAEMNTYMKMLINGMSGLIDSVYNDGVAQNEINATSTSEQVKDYIVAGLNQIIKTSKVNDATHADKATNVDEIINNFTGDNATVSFTIGDKTFSKKVNNVAHSDKAAALDSINIGDATHPVYFDAEGKPVKIGTVAVSAAANKLTSSRQIILTGDATGTASFDGTDNARINAFVLKSSALRVAKQIGGIYTPVYFNADGMPVEVTKINNAFMADKLTTGRTITIAGAVSGSADFDGSKNVTINTVSSDINATQMVDSTGNDLNVGDAYTVPVYFKDGKPTACDLMFDLVDTSNAASEYWTWNSSLSQYELKAGKTPAGYYFFKHNGKVYNLGLAFTTIIGIRDINANFTFVVDAANFIRLEFSGVAGSTVMLRAYQNNVLMTDISISDLIMYPLNSHFGG